MTKDELLNLCTAALKAQQAIEDHFGSCHNCGGNLRGDVWHCPQWSKLWNEAYNLRGIALKELTSDKAGN